MTDRRATQAQRVLRSLTFRYGVKYLLVLTGTVVVITLLLYGLYIYRYFNELSRSIIEEQDTLKLVYNGQGLDGVFQYMRDQRDAQILDRFHYMVVDGDGKRVGGDLPEATSYRMFDDGWFYLELGLMQWGEAVDVEFIARMNDLGSGYRAIVARDYQSALLSGRLVFTTLAQAMLVTILLGLVGGYLAAQRSMQRMEWLGREMSRIIRGDPSKRLDVSAETGHVVTLAKLMNGMLDQTESLMQGIRGISDNIAHDLRTPLGRLRNQLVRLQDSLPEERRPEVDGVIAECDHLLQSFNAVLRISSLESGSFYSGQRQVELARVLRDAVELYEPLAHEKDISLNFRPPTRLAQTRGDADLLFQLFSNVIDNAIKYTPRNGEVAVSLSAGGPAQMHRVIIADTGPGISAEHWEDVFRRFYRVDPSRSAQPGHGLGLSMAQAVAHYHGGRVDLEGNDPGLRVVISLPYSSTDK